MFMPALSPNGTLTLRSSEEAVALPHSLSRALELAFTRGAGHGLLVLGADAVGAALSPQLSYLRDFAGRYVTALCALPDISGITSKPAVPPPAADELERLADTVPPMPGAEYATASVLAELWRGTDAAFDAELTEAGVPVQEFLKSRHPAWNLVGRVHFNLAENRRDEDAPFAFLATYTTRLSAAAKAQHLPLGKALEEYRGAKNRERLLSLLLPVQRAAESCSWLKSMVDAGEIYHPLRWSPAEALHVLKDAAVLEAAGVVVRMPASWGAKRPAHPQVKATVGGKAPSQLGLGALLDFKVEVTLDGETLTKAEIRQLLAQSEGLALVRGKWIEIDHDRLSRTLEQFEAVESRARNEGLSFVEAMRMVAGASVSGAAAELPAAADWGKAVAGPWLSEMLAGLRHPDGLARVDPGPALKAHLRPYQHAGVQWLHLLTTLRLGACLADDMGLGKTIQVLSLLLVLKQQAGSTPAGKRNEKTAAAERPSLLVAPASLLANWTGEIDKFAPDLKAVIAHPSAMPLKAPYSLPAPTCCALAHWSSAS